MSAFNLLDDGEPRGEPFDEPRPDDLWLDREHDCWRNENQKQVCGAHLASKDRPHRCRRTKLQPNGRCHTHGGHTPKGADHGAFKHGKYSDALPDGVREQYEETRDDEHLTDLREEIAVIETRIHRVLESLEEQDSAQLWGDLSETFSEFKAARDAGDTDTMGRKMVELTDLIERGAKARSRWEEIGNLIERKRRLVDSERRREKALQAYVPMEEFVASMHRIDKIFRSHIEDQQVIQQIARALKREFNLG